MPPKKGLDHLQRNEQLEATAQDFADYMARTDRYGHSADGRQARERTKAHDYSFCLIAENIAYRSVSMVNLEKGLWIIGQSADFSRTGAGLPKAPQEYCEMTIGFFHDRLVFIGGDEFLASADRRTFQATQRRARELAALNGPVEESLYARDRGAKRGIFPAFGPRPGKDARTRNRHRLAGMVIAEIFQIAVVPSRTSPGRRRFRGPQETACWERAATEHSTEMPQLQHELVVQLLGRRFVVAALNELPPSTRTVQYHQPSKSRYQGLQLSIKKPSNVWDERFTKATSKGFAKTSLVAPSGVFFLRLVQL
jgi:hypothetical protein